MSNLRVFKPISPIFFYFFAPEVGDFFSIRNFFLRPSISFNVKEEVEKMRTEEISPTPVAKKFQKNLGKSVVETRRWGMILVKFTRRPHLHQSNYIFSPAWWFLGSVSCWWRRRGRPGFQLDRNLVTSNDHWSTYAKLPTQFDPKWQ